MTFAVCRKLDLSCVSYSRVQFRHHRRETCSIQGTLLSLSTNTLHILYHAVTVTTTGTGFCPVRPLNAFWNKMLPVYLMGFNTDNVFVQRKFIINFYMKLKLSSSKSLWRAYHPPPDCLRCDWQGDKKVSLRFPKLLSYPILSPCPFVPTLSYSFSTLCYHALLTLAFPTRSYLTPSHPFPSHPILSHPIPSTYCILNFPLETCHQVFLYFCRICCIFSS